MFIKLKVINWGEIIINSNDIQRIETYRQSALLEGNNSSMVTLKSGEKLLVEQSVTRIYKYLNKEKYYNENKKKYFRDQNSGYQPKSDTEVPPNPPTSGSNAVK